MIRFHKVKVFSIWILVGFLTTWTISCSSGNISTNNKPNQSGVAEIQFWTMQLQPQFTDYFQSLIGNFESHNQGIKVNWVDVPWAAMENKILTAVSANTPPDVVNLNPDFASQLAEKNTWLDLDTKVSDVARSEYLPNIWQASTLNGKSFGIPWYLTTRLTIYKLIF